MGGLILHVCPLAGVRLSCHLLCVLLPVWVLAPSPVGSLDPKIHPPELSQVGACCSSPPLCGARGSLCLTWGAVPRLSFLARCQRGELVGAGCRQRCGGAPPAPQSFTLPSPLLGLAWSLSPGLHEGASPVGLLFSWELLAVEGKGVSFLVPPVPCTEPPEGCS